MITNQEPSENTYTKLNVQEITGISARKLQYYTDGNIVKPIKKRTGKGYKRLYRYRSIVKCMLINKFQSFGLSLNYIANIFTYIRDNKIDSTWTAENTSSNMNNAIVIFNIKSEQPDISVVNVLELHNQKLWSRNRSDAIIVYLEDIFRTIKDRIVSLDNAEAKPVKQTSKKKSVHKKTGTAKSPSKSNAKSKPKTVMLKRLPKTES